MFLAFVDHKFTSPRGYWLSNLISCDATLDAKIEATHLSRSFERLLLAGLDCALVGSSVIRAAFSKEGGGVFDSQKGTSEDSSQRDQVPLLQ